MGRITVHPPRVYSRPWARPGHVPKASRFGTAMKKRIVICCDGTWNKRDGDKPTNVSKLAQAVPPVGEDGIPQVVFYDQGVGTGAGADRWLGGTFGVGLSRNVIDAYRFLVDNYSDGGAGGEPDEIFVFGFSRGAFTARSMTGFLRKAGLLPKHCAEQFPRAYDLYRSDIPVDDPRVVAYRAETGSRDAVVTMLGVWDTVGALGIPGHLGQKFPFRLVNRDYEFHDVQLSSKAVRNAYQALAIDEERDPFEPAIWWRRQPAAGAYPQVMEQRWFAGCHSDVGGGTTTYREAERDGCLSDVALVWMMEKAKALGLGFDDRYQREHIHPNPLARIHDSRRGLGAQMLYRRKVREIGLLPNDTALNAELDRRRAAHSGEPPESVPPPIETNQSLHPSVIQRAAATPYNPGNLARYRARTGE